jgi:hypothetical protein
MYISLHIFNFRITEICAANFLLIFDFLFTLELPKLVEFVDSPGKVF